MATIYTKNEPEEWPDNDPKIQAYRALQKASERMGINDRPPASTPASSEPVGVMKDANVRR